MADERQSSDGAAAGDPVQGLLLGLAEQLDAVAALVGSADLAELGALAGVDGERIAGLLGTVGTLVGELGDVLGRLLAALIAVLEAVAEVLSAAPDGSAARAATNFEEIPVRIAMTGPAL